MIDAGGARPRDDLDGLIEHLVDAERRLTVAFAKAGVDSSVLNDMRLLSNAAVALRGLRERIAALEAERDALKQDVVWLLQRARAIINRWQELYGEHQPQFLPPAHQIEWAEDASEFIDAARERP